MKSISFALSAAVLLIMGACPDLEAQAAAVVFEIDGSATADTQKGEVQLAPGMVLDAGDVIHVTAGSFVEIVVPARSLEPILVADGDRWQVPESSADLRMDLPSMGRSRAGVNWRGEGSSQEQNSRRNGPLLPYWTRLARPRLTLSWADMSFAGEEVELTLTDLANGEVVEKFRTEITSITLPEQALIHRGTRYRWTLSSGGSEAIVGQFEVLLESELVDLRSRLVDMNSGNPPGHSNEWLLEAILLLDRELNLDAGRILGEAYSTTGSPAARAWLERVRGLLSGSRVHHSVGPRTDEINQKGPQNEN